MPFPKDVIEKVRKRSRNKCCVCQAPFVEVHHIIPEGKRGPNTEDNAAALCAGCHDTYGNNPDKRKQIREMRDAWYMQCEPSSSASTSGEVNVRVVLAGLQLEVFRNRQQAESILIDLSNLLHRKGLIPLRRLSDKATTGLLQHPLPALANGISLLSAYSDEVTMFNQLVDLIVNPSSPDNHRANLINQALPFGPRLAASGELLLHWVKETLK